MDLLQMSPINVPERSDLLEYESSVEEKTYNDDDIYSVDISPISDNDNTILSNTSLRVKFSEYCLQRSCNIIEKNNNNGNSVINFGAQTNDMESQVPQHLRRKKSIFDRLYPVHNVHHKPRVNMRMSILGKPLTPHHIQVSFYKQKVAVYNFLQRPRGYIAIGYHVFASCVVFTCLVLTVISTVKGICFDIFKNKITFALKFSSAA